MMPATKEKGAGNISRRGKVMRVAAKLLMIAAEPFFKGQPLLTLEQLAKKTGRTERACHDQLQRMGMLDLLAGRNRRGQDIIELLDEVGDGVLNRAQASEILGVKYQYVVYYAKHLNLGGRFLADSTADGYDKFRTIMDVIGRSEEKLTIKEIMEKTGYTRNQVSHQLRSYRHLVTSERARAAKARAAEAAKVKLAKTTRKAVVPVVVIKVEPPANTPFNNLLKSKF